MKLVWEVIRWEVGRHLRNKQFLIGLFITPLMIVLFGGVPQLLQRLDRPDVQRYLVVDQLGVLPALQERLAGSHVILEGRDFDVEALQDEVLAKEAEGYFILDERFVTEGVLPVYLDRLKMRPDVLEAALADVFRQLRLAQRNVDAELYAYLSAEPVLVPTVFGSEGANDLGALPMAIAFSVLLFLMIMGSGSMLLMSALQEKRDRMSEVVLSSVSPDTLMSGKIIAHFLLGILQISFWLAIGLPLTYFVLDVPLGEYIVPSLIPLYALFTLLGYLLFASIYVGVGATMENMESASNSQGMVMLLPVFSVILVGPVVVNPDGLLARVATLFPITSPTITVLRSGLTDIPAWELAAAIAILLATTFVVVKASARIFRVGMLMYGKNATLREILRWMRHA